MDKVYNKVILSLWAYCLVNYVKINRIRKRRTKKEGKKFK